MRPSGAIYSYWASGARLTWATVGDGERSEARGRPGADEPNRGRGWNGIFLGSGRSWNGTFLGSARSWNGTFGRKLPCHENPLRINGLRVVQDRSGQRRRKRPIWLYADE